MVHHSTADIIGSLVLLGIATWWVVAPTTYIACIRKVPFLWTSAYPLNTKPWFPRYLCVLGLFFWALALVILLVSFAPSLIRGQ